MKSRTRGSGGNDADVQAWEAQISSNQDETTTAIDSADHKGSGTATINATGGYTYKITADSSSELKTAKAADTRAKARIGSSGAGNASMLINTSGVIVERIGFISEDTASIVVLSYDVQLRRLGLESGDGTASGGGIYFDGSGYTLSIMSNLFFTGCGYYLVNGAPSVNAGALKFYHCSALLGANTPFLGFYPPGASAYYYACIVQYTTAPIGTCYGARTAMAGDQNVAEDTSADDGSLTNAWNSKSGVFKVETAGSEDLSLSAAHDAGTYTVTDRSTDVPDLATDIAGTTRSAPIDAGAVQTASSTSAISGSTTFSFAPAAVIRAKGASVGSATVSFAPAAAIIGRAPLTASATVSFSSTAAAIRAKGALAGSPTVSFSSAAAIQAKGKLAGTQTFGFAPSGTMRAKGGLAGSGTVTFSPAASFKLGAIQGASTVTFSSAAALGGTGRVLGQATGTFSASGTPQAKGAATGSAQVSFAPTAAILAKRHATGTAAIGFAPVAVLLGKGQVIGSAAVAFGPAAVLTAHGSLAASMTVTCSLTATPSFPLGVNIRNLRIAEGRRLVAAETVHLRMSEDT